MGPPDVAGLLAAIFLAAVSSASCHALLGGRGHQRRLLSAAQPAQPLTRSCGTPQVGFAVLAGHLPRLEQMVYGGVTATMSAVRLQQAIEQSDFPNSGITVPVHYHVIMDQWVPNMNDRSHPTVSNSDVAAQTDVLNRDYSGTGISFRLTSINRHVNRTWAENCEGMAREIAALVERDPAEALNVILCDMYARNGPLGMALSWPAPGFDEFSRSQAVVVDYNTLPGGAFARYNQGRTLTHEVGHWCGLLHTFSDNCAIDADGIADTPVQLKGVGGCQVGRDSCPAQPGLDPINNFMGYSDDSCMRNFTLGQVARMQGMLLAYRPNLLSVATNTPSSAPDDKAPAASLPQAAARQQTKRHRRLSIRTRLQHGNTAAARGDNSANLGIPLEPAPTSDV